MDTEPEVYAADQIGPAPDEVEQTAEQAGEE